jgi:hypothetical protein
MTLVRVITLSNAGGKGGDHPHCSWVVLILPDRSDDSQDLFHDEIGFLMRDEVATVSGEDEPATGMRLHLCACRRLRCLPQSGRLPAVHQFSNECRDRHIR